MDPLQTGTVVVLALAVVAFILWPMLERKDRPAARAIDVERVEQRILEYREALRRRTVCERCLYANPAGSRFCAECGARITAGVDAPAQPGARRAS